MNLKQFLSDSFVQKAYVSAGADLGDAISYGLDIFPCDGRAVSSLVNKLKKWETEYSKRGFRTIPISRFVDFGGYDISLDDVIGKKRESGENPILHALSLTAE